MADAIKLDFPDLEMKRIPDESANMEDENPPTVDSSPSELEPPTGPIAQAALPHKTEVEVCPPRYELEAYYQDDAIAKDVIRNKYLAPWESNPFELWARQAKGIASVEATDELRQEWEKSFLHILEDFRFVPGGRIMHGAGRDDIKTTLNNCYVVGIENDSINAIYQAVIDEALTYKFGGGCGHDLSVLRPSGSPIGGTGGESCGPTGFMDLFSINTNTIAQHGRRGANMQTLKVDHPDIEDFIGIKNNLDRVKYSNISVLLTNDFMHAVEHDEPFELKWGGQVYRTVNALELWGKITHAAHAHAEPGLIFWDTMKEYHNGEYTSPLISTNPCAEQPLPNGGCCNLGSINLERFVDDVGNFMYNDFKDTVVAATRFLDNVIDYNVDRHALDIQKKSAVNDRRIGLGILGLGDMLVRMQIKYDSEEALKTVDEVMKVMRDTAYEASINLANEKGQFPAFKWSGYSKSKFVKQLPKKIRKEIKENGIRNVTILTVAPTGSGAIVAQVTSGIEPIFATSYKRRVKKNQGFGEDYREYTVYHPVIRNLFGSDQDLPEYISTAHDIDPFFRVKMQGVIQQYIDSSISSTVNLPEDISVETVADIYMKAYQEGLKGITVYREGSREGILISEKKKGADAEDSAPATEPLSSSEQTAMAAHPTLHPRSRPEVTSGVTRRVRTGEGNLYITINEDEHGLCEVFTTIGKAGGMASAQAEAISRLISLALRSGVDAREVAKQLKGISGPNPTWESGRLILSTPDAIGQAIEDHLNQAPLLKQVEGDAATKQVEAVSAATIIESKDIIQPQQESSVKTMSTCPDCGGNVVHESGCIICPSCGYSRC